MPTTELFDTTAIHAGARLRYWQDLVRTAFDNMEIEPASQRFSARMHRRGFGSVHLTTVESTPVAIDSRRSSKYDGIYLMRNEHGSCEVYQHGRQARLQAGELVVLCARDPYRIECSRDHRTRVLYLPGSDLADQLAAQIAIAHRGEQFQLLGNFIAHLDHLGGEQHGPTLLTTASALLALTWPAAADTHSGRSTAPAWRARLRQHVHQHLSEPGLGAQSIANHFGITPRYVQLLFAAERTSLGAYVLEQRLQRVAERLRDPVAGPIGEIALEAGFSDVSHFCRCFRKRFGCSARAYRDGTRDG
ncbi:helix-turn-helix domain-containing protein [Xanthomonas axonopodis pv. begoniae]|uniref:helix-turn-helix domain-containing protein n=1 Tax=Xanthomonas phaseoli TaxID=1985254 RepID=UPI000CED8C84|nr:helix-turn-helix domain-containing protein [Xanthomonas phaseoli]MBO9740913.1 helix-turn-helix domain-containing protein [Xanthomonas axonopodis pv. begoniae]MBO9770706.1 helix-turn-helix domain-containing protein [Xanthomonas axonopodis pv. begoniae]MCC8470498.1 helix-turn-helix domain-containing protein [Xanthomonas phaseoli]PPT35858.1 AraC family transcriptional regulator [Xanthomonas axonopodis pv. begoniae]